ncbi:vanadium-dependent haloperoxidase [Ferruginibacter paludis]|uniref:vanadium-dependent haloperoxidase n=1 Tax=Ferruginibacter paludis TaxID=1310417 RepID=UPI0025B482CA|nr:vanadium-dependent haloperoxidase [Ferruginibacter paludis]MDN3655967.1 vanadium-dependent haloperoxidase [Ferruginibacter paludis]
MKKLLNLLLLSAIIFLSCQKQPENALNSKKLAGETSARSDGHAYGTISSTMVLKWNEAATQAIANMAPFTGSGPLPPMPESRIYAMINVAMHDALNNIVPRYQTYALKDARDKDADANAAVAQAAHDVIAAMLPPQQPFADNLLIASLASVTDGDSKTRGIGLGKAAAKAILNLRMNDGANVAQFPYIQGTLPGQYRATPPFDGPPFNGFVAVPGWGNITPFCLTSGSQFRPVPPYAINSAEYTADYNDIKSLGAAAGSTRTADQTEIAIFYLENAPLHFNRIARAMIEKYKLDPWKSARLLALLQLAEADANIACLNAKFYYNFWRPITAVHLGDTDGNANTTGDATWNVLAPPTPPVPDYPSNHAVNGGAGAAILMQYFGTDNISYTQTSSSLPGVTRTLTGFSQSAMENALSRVYVGYHFRNACLKGVDQGYKVGKYVFENYLKEN